MMDIDINQCVLTGKAVMAEVRYSKNNYAVPKFNLEVSDGEHTTTLQCVWWGKKGIDFIQNLMEGQQLVVRGKLQSRQFTDYEGNEKTTVQVVVSLAYPRIFEQVEADPFMSSSPF